MKKLKFKYSSKKVKAGKKVNLSKWLKVTKNRAGDAKITYKFTKSKYKKYATLSKKGVFKAKKAGKKKTVYVKAAAGDGSEKLPPAPDDGFMEIPDDVSDEGLPFN